MVAKVDLAGQRYGRLVVACEAPSIIERSGRRRIAWECICDCGSKLTVRSNDLRYGRTLSCGCLNRDVVVAMRTKHGHSKSGDGTKPYSPEYNSWRALRERCLNPKSIGYKNYGERGIKVCDRWRDSFEAFLADMGNRPPGTTIDRKDPDGDYEPNNCRWATRLEQRHNRRTKKHTTEDRLR